MKKTLAIGLMLISNLALADGFDLAEFAGTYRVRGGFVGDVSYTREFRFPDEDPALGHRHNPLADKTYELLNLVLNWTEGARKWRRGEFAVLRDQTGNLFGYAYSSANGLTDMPTDIRKLYPLHEVAKPNAVYAGDYGWNYGSLGQDFWRFVFHEDRKTISFQRLSQGVCLLHAGPREDFPCLIFYPGKVYIDKAAYEFHRL